MPMSEEKELTGIERELVLQYLRDDNVPVTVTLEEKPEQAETDISDDKTPFPAKDERIPLSAVFPVAIKSQQMKVLDKGIILLDNDVRMVEPFVDKTVRVQFYFNRLGLYFVTKMQTYSQGLALVVPASIKRIAESNPVNQYSVSARISFNSSSSEVNIDCVPCMKYNLYVQPKWGDIELEKQKAAKSFLEKIVANVKNGNSKPYGTGVQLFPVCRYLTDEQQTETSSVEGRVQPLEIIYFDNTQLVLGTRQKENTLTPGAEYNVCLTFTLEANKLLKRKVQVKAIVENIYSSEDGKSECYVLNFISVKEEDVRFLYERSTGQKFSD